MKLPESCCVFKLSELRNNLITHQNAYDICITNNHKQQNQRKIKIRYILKVSVVNFFSFFLHNNSHFNIEYRFRRIIISL